MKSLHTEGKKRAAHRRRIFLIATGAALVLAVIAGWWAWQRSTVPPDNPAQPAEEPADVKTTTPPVDTSKPTNDGQQTTPPPANEPPANTKKDVSPVISYAGYADEATKQQVEVDAFVPGVLEENGTCTLTATKGSLKVTAQTTGHQNVSQTRCDNFVVDRSKFASAGTWTIVVLYDSPTAQGSATRNLEL